MPRIGLIGVGLMGSAFARHLLDAGFEVAGYDIDPERTRTLTASGGNAADSTAEVVHAAELVLTSLPSSAAFEKATTEIAEAAGEASAVADTSTLPLEVKERGRDRLALRGVPLLDCPVSGTSQQARAKDAIVYASGDPATLERFAAVFRGFARAWYDVGPFGAGSALKFAANLLVAVHNVAAAEALLLVRNAGLDPHRAVELLADGAGGSRMLQVRGPLMAAGDYESDPGVRTRLLNKDIGIIKDFAQGHGSPTPLLEAAARIHAAAQERGRGDQDPACVYEILKDTAP